jgi:predicted phage tail protein
MAMSLAFSGVFATAITRIFVTTAQMILEDVRQMLTRRPRTAD